MQAANVNASGRDQAIASVAASFVAKAAGTTPEPRTRPMASRGADIANGDMPTSTAAPSVREHPNWDVYRSGLGTSALVYER